MYDVSDIYFECGGERMINIAIIDDEEILLDQISHLIRSVSVLQNEIHIDCFTSAEEFLNSNLVEKSYHIVFTDIQLKAMDGIKLGMIIRERYPSVYLVFLTSYSEYAAESYELNAYQYILKQRMEERLPVILKYIIYQISKKQERYRLLGGTNHIQKVYYQDIIYIKKIKGSKYVEYITLKDEFRERISLDQLMKELNSNEFILVERSYIVNIQYIVRLKRNTIFLKNDKAIMVSRLRFPEVKEAIHKYWERKHE